MSQRRILANVVATYAQNGLSFVVGMFSLRWSYLALGEEAYGLFVVVGSILAFAGLFNGLMTNSNARFFAVAIGEGRRFGEAHGQKELTAWFGTSFSAHLVMALLLCTILIPIGEHLIRHRLTIGTDLIPDALIVFRISLGVLFFTLLQTPFHALYTAKQFIFVRNFIGMLQTLFTAAEGWWLLHWNGNRIIGHSVASAGIMLLLYTILVGLAIKTFPECRAPFRTWFDRRRLIALFSYSSFSIFGSLGGLFAGPCVNIVVNTFFGKTGNAVIGVGQRISGKLETFSEAITAAIFPEVTSLVGASEIRKAENTAVVASFLSCFPTFALAIPLLFWMDTFVRMLLNDPPHGAASVICILIVVSLILRITSGYQMMIHASGRIKAYMVTLGTINMSCPLVLLILLCFGIDLVPALAVAWIAPRTALSAGRLLFARRILGTSLLPFVRCVFLPAMLCVCFSVALCAAIRITLGHGLAGCAVALLINVLLLTIGVFLFHPIKEVRDFPRHLLATIRP